MLKKRNVVVFLSLALILALVLNVTAFAVEGGILGTLADLKAFFVRLIVPDKNYFHNALGAISAHANERLGGVAYLYHMINNFFNELRYAPTAGLSFSLPNNFFFRGYRGMNFDFLASAKPYVDFIRNVTTAAYCIFIGICCYHKLRTFFNEQE